MGGGAGARPLARAYWAFAAATDPHVHELAASAAVATKQAPEATARAAIEAVGGSLA